MSCNDFRHQTRGFIEFSASIESSAKLAYLLLLGSLRAQRPCKTRGLSTAPQPMRAISAWMYGGLTGSPLLSLPDALVFKGLSNEAFDELPVRGTNLAGSDLVKFFVVGVFFTKFCPPTSHYRVKLGRREKIGIAL